MAFVMDHGLGEGVVNPAIARMASDGLGGGADGCGPRGLAAGKNGFHSHLRMVVVGGSGEEGGGVLESVLPTPGHARGKGTRAMILGAQNAFQQCWLHGLHHRASRQCLEQMAVVVGIVGVELRCPSCYGVGGFWCRALGKLVLRLLARPALVGFQQLEQVLGFGTDNFWQRHRLDTFHADTPDAAVMEVAGGVAKVIVLMADDRVVKVGDVQGTIGTDLDVHRAKIAMV